jgi:uncharacterized protein (DUF362 family)
MKPAQRKLGEPIPTRLVLNQKGELFMVDGSSVPEYLKACRRMWGAKGHLQVVISPRLSIENLEQEALLRRSHSA